MPSKKRALILAGGGLKVGFQAGVLEVWLDEAGLTFDHADGASGGCFNLAMYCQGMTGKQIADNWRNLNPFLPVDLNWEHYWRFLHAPSLFTYDNFRERVLPFWGIDWSVINRGTRLGTFNYFNFSKKRLETPTHEHMTEDQLIACVSLPMWFPPVTIGGDTCIDSVYISDANVEEAIRRGADELWAIWTVSTRDEWRDGFIAQYFHIIETTANTNFFGIWRRIEESNRQIAAGRTGAFGRHIELRLLQAEVPVHYLFNLSRDRMAEAVNLGVKTAREWCRQQGVPLARTGPDYPGRVQSTTTSLSFTEEMKGFAAAGATEPADGYERGKRAGTRLAVRLTIKIDDVDRFVVDPDHEAAAEGWVDSPIIGGRRPVTRGIFNLFVHDEDPAKKRMDYRLFFETADGRPGTLSGFKDIHDDGARDVWSDTTTLYVRWYERHVLAADERGATILGAGIIRIGHADFLRQLTTFRAVGPTLGDRLAAMRRFGALFLGKLWDVYGRHVIDVGPF
jgi:predicted acylesterase/phospholipase RssA